MANCAESDPERTFAKLEVASPLLEWQGGALRRQATCQRESDLSCLYSSASTKLSRLQDFTTQSSVLQRKARPAAGVAALVYLILGEATG